MLRSHLNYFRCSKSNQLGVSSYDAYIPLSILDLGLGKPPSERDAGVTTESPYNQVFIALRHRNLGIGKTGIAGTFPIPCVGLAFGQ